jgi:hypothetical protein
VGHRPFAIRRLTATDPRRYPVSLLDVTELVFRVPDDYLVSASLQKVKPSAHREASSMRIHRKAWPQRIEGWTVRPTTALVESRSITTRSVVTSR